MNWHEFGAWLAWQLTIFGGWALAVYWFFLKVTTSTRVVDVVPSLLAFIAAMVVVKLLYEYNTGSRRLFR